MFGSRGPAARTILPRCNAKSPTYPYPSRGGGSVRVSRRLRHVSAPLVSSRPDHWDRQAPTRILERCGPRRAVQIAPIMMSRKKAYSFQISCLMVGRQSELVDFSVDGRESPKTVQDTRLTRYGPRVRLLSSRDRSGQGREACESCSTCCSSLRSRRP